MAGRGRRPGPWPCRSRSPPAGGVGWWGDVGGMHQRDSALRRARARVGRGVRVQLDPYLGGDSVGGLALA